MEISLQTHTQPGKVMILTQQSKASRPPPTSSPPPSLSLIPIPSPPIIPSLLFTQEHLSTVASRPPSLALCSQTLTNYIERGNQCGHGPSH